MEKEAITVGEAAKLLGVTPTTLRNWDKNGLLKPHRDSTNRYRLYELGRVLEIKNKRIPDNTNLSISKDRELRSIIKGINNIFRDSNGGGVLYRLEEITKLFFCKLLSENQNNNIFSDALLMSDDIVFEKLNRLYRKAMNDLPFAEGTRLSLGADKKAISESVRMLAGVSLKRFDDDIKGRLFEDLIANTFDKNENQQFFTPRTIVDFMIDSIGIQKGEIVLDPACGTGGFLIGTARKKADSKLVGVEIDGFMAWVANMNLYLHDAKHYKVTLLNKDGSLGRQAFEVQKKNSVDVIITNPPFGSDMTGPVLQQFELGRSRRSRRRGALFVERCLDWLKPGGRMAIVLEDSILNGQSNSDVRELLLDKADILSIVSLPELAFKPYASVKTSIVFLQKRSKSSNRSDTFFCEVENVGRKPNGDSDFSDSNKLNNDLPLVTKLMSASSASSSAKSINHYRMRLNNRLDEESNRLDFLYHHPIKEEARSALSSLPYNSKKLGEIVEAVNVNSVPNIEDPDSDIDFIGLADIESGTGHYTIQKIKGSRLKSSVKAFSSGDILFSKMRPELRKVCLIKGKDGGFTSSECLVLRIKEFNKEIIPEYLELMLRSDLLFGQVIHQVTGIGRPRLTKSSLMDVSIPVPSYEKQNEVISKVKAILLQSKKMKENSRNLLFESKDKIRDSQVLASKILA